MWTSRSAATLKAGDQQKNETEVGMVSRQTMTSGDREPTFEAPEVTADDHVLGLADAPA